MRHVGYFILCPESILARFVRFEKDQSGRFEGAAGYDETK